MGTTTDLQLCSSISNESKDSKRINATMHGVPQAISWGKKTTAHLCKVVHDMMKEQAGMLCHASTARADVAQLVTLQPMEAADYTGIPATLSACSLLISRASVKALLQSMPAICLCVGVL